MKLRAAALLAAVLMIGTAGSASANPVGPVFARADSTQGNGGWTGYTANIQVRPLDYAVWIGGFLSDGATFAQSGLAYIDGQYYAFGLAFNGGTLEANCENWTPISAPLYSWVTFRLTRGAGNIWYFRYQDATGWHDQCSFTLSATLANFQIAHEMWTAGPQWFPTQAIQHAWVRNTVGQYINTTMVWSTDSTTCQYERLRSTTPSNVVIESVNSCPPSYVVLW